MRGPDMELGKQTVKKQVRHPELDIAKGFGICFMVLVHTFLQYYPYSEEPNGIFVRTMLFLGRFPGAPVFMFCLGCGVVLSRRNGAGDFLKRGIATLALGYLVMNVATNVIAWVLFALKGGYLNGDYLVTILRYIPETLPYVDILQFAGLTFLFFALVKALDLKDWMILPCAMVMSLLGMILRLVVPVEDLLVKTAAGLLWGSVETSCFPLFSWIIFPCAGYLFCKYLLGPCENKNRMYAMAGLAGAVVYAVLSWIGLKQNISVANFGEQCLEGDYYHMSLYGNVAALAFVLFWLWICRVAAIALPRWLMAVFQRLSRHITEIYVVHLFLLKCMYMILPEGSFLSKGGILVLSLVILLLSEGSSSLWAKLKKA